MNTNSPQTPPPPYERTGQRKNSNKSRGRDSHELAMSNETIPKMASYEREVSQQNLRAPGIGQVSGEELRNPIASIDCDSRKWARTSPIDQHSQFREALSSPKRFFGSITIEPLAFIALLALYIEFPSIQDLIYTKICLQVVARHPNLTSNYHRQIPMPISVIPHLNRTHRSFNQSIEHQLNGLPENGRIQQSGGQLSTGVIDRTGFVGSEAHFLCDRLNKSAIPPETRQEIADYDSLFWLKYQIIICVLCALSCPYWGGISDSIGRLIPLNVPILTSVLSNLISLIFGLLISLNSHSMFDLNWLYIGAVLVGLSGGQAVLILNSFSFISDNSSSENRSKRVVILEAVIYLSHSAGFYLTRHIMSLGLASPERPWLNRHFVAFSSCIILNLMCTLYSILKLRHYKFHKFLNNFEREQQEAFAGQLHTQATLSIGGGTLERKNGCDAEFSSANSERPRELTLSTPDDLDGQISRNDRNWAQWGNFLTFRYYKETFVTATRQRESRTMIILILICGFISAMCLTSLMSLLFIYLRLDPFNWNTSRYSSWNSWTSISRGLALVSLSVAMKFIPQWNVPDPLIAAIGFLSKGIGLVMIALAQSSAIIDFALIAFVLSEFSMPPLRSLLSKLVVKEEVGKIYSCLAAVQSICFLLGSIIFYLAYTTLGLNKFFRLTFLIVGGFQFCAIFIMLFVYTTLRHRVVVV